MDDNLCTGQPHQCYSSVTVWPVRGGGTIKKPPPVSHRRGLIYSAPEKPATARQRRGLLPVRRRALRGGHKKQKWCANCAALESTTFAEVACDRVNTLAAISCS